MAFEFIDNSSIDSATRKRIRSHAALGKNAGRTLNRSSRKNAQGPRVMTATTLIRIPKTVQDAFRSDREEEPVPEVERQIDDGICFPVQLASESRRLARRVFHFLSGPRFAPELSEAIDCTGTSVSIWVQYMLVDEAYFHCTLATSIAAMSKLLCEKEDVIDAMRHLSRTFHIINERLASNRAVSDETIAAVVGMAQYERHMGDYARGRVHMQGLRRMTALRGGITQLSKDKPSLTQKVFRIDLEYALQLGTTPLFTVTDVQVGSKRMFGTENTFKRPEKRGVISDEEINLTRHIRSDLWDLALDIKHAATQVNESNAKLRPRLNSFEFHHTMIRFGYELLAINTIGGVQLSNSTEILLHLGLAAFLMTFLRGLDRLVANNPLLSEFGRIAGHVGTDQSECQRLYLWFLLVGRCSIFREIDEEWLIPKLKDVTHRLNLSTWEDVIDTMSIFPWVDSLHNKTSRTIWQTARQDKAIMGP